MTGSPIRILIADDHDIVRKGLCALLDAKPGVVVVGEAADGEEAIVKAKTLQPDVILLDLLMPNKGGIAAIHEIREHDPEAKILVLTSFTDDNMVFSAIKGGALGYLLKDSKPQELLEAIVAVSRGQASLHPTIALKMIQEVRQVSHRSAQGKPITSREMAVLKLIAQGHTNAEIANTLSISERTVTTHVSNILAKLHLANRTQAALFALRQGWAELKR
jgi:NarL family two-component system response regulator LiaR